MSNSLPLNPFLSVRPRGADVAPAKAPRKTNHSRAPIEGNVQRALDSKGRPTVTMPPRTAGAITIESRTASAASMEKRRKISKGGTK